MVIIIYKRKYLTKTNKEKSKQVALPLPANDPKSCVNLIYHNYPTLICITFLQYYTGKGRDFGELDAFYYHAEASISVHYCNGITNKIDNYETDIVAVAGAETRKAAEKLVFSIILDKLVLGMQKITEKNPRVEIMRHN